MTPLCAKIRIDMYEARYGAMDAQKIVDEIRLVSLEIRNTSPFAGKFKKLTRKRFELNNYLESINTLASST